MGQKAYLIAEEGNLAGTQIGLDEEDEWILGRDPDVCFYVLEDPMVSRKHLLIRQDGGVYTLENLSNTNPVAVNGEDVIDPVELQQNDMVQVGSTTFRFSLEEAPITEEPTRDLGEETEAKSESPLDAIEEEEISLGDLTFTNDIHTRWMIKIVAGPNTGAEFAIKEGQTYTIGKDPDAADILLQDLSVSRQHAKFHCSDEGVMSVEDLGSRNGVLINGAVCEGTQPVKSQDLVSLGTSACLIIDRTATSETIYSPPSMTTYTDHELSAEEKEAKEKEESELREELALKRNWKETFIPFKHIAIGCLVLLIVCSGVVGVISLFQSKPIQVAVQDNHGTIKKILKDFPAVTFSYDKNTGKLFLAGHVMTDVEYQELLYLVKSQQFVKSLDDNVVIDELVWENMNALLYKNPNWRSVLVTGTRPGHFVIKGYLQAMEERAKLTDYVNRNFPYLDKFVNEVVVENNLETNINSLLSEYNFDNVRFQLSNGEVVFAGRIDHTREAQFQKLLKGIDTLPGVRQIKNFVVPTTAVSSRQDLTSKYKVTGTSKYGNVNQFVLINGKILSIGEPLDGMVITAINPNSIFLEKEGMKYKIDYNLQ